MTTAVAGPAGVDMNDPFQLALLLGAVGTGTPTATHWQAVDGNFLFSFTGVGFGGYQFKIPSTGTVTAIDITNGGLASFSVSGFSVPLPTLFTHLVTDTPAQLAAFMFSGADSITGGAASDVLIGYDGDDVITDDLGADLLQGGDGNDTLSGGANNDVLFGDSGDDNLSGGTGDDQLNGGAGSNTLNAGDGNDFVTSTGLADTIDGGAGTDTLSLDWSSAIGAITADVTGGAVVVTGGGSVQNIEQLATLFSGAGNDNVRTGAAIDFRAGAGDDTLMLTNGLVNAHFDGGAGNDTLIADFSALAGVTMNGANINEVLTYANVEAFTITGSLTGANDLIGGSGDDNFTTGAGADRLVGGDGNDTLVSGGGNDELHGDAGVNVLSAGAGDDVVFSSSNDTINGGDGVDTLVVDVSSSAANLFLDASAIASDTGSVLLAGGLVRNVEILQVSSGSGDDTLTLSGLTGNANFFGGGAGNDRLVLDLSAATDVVLLSFAQTVSINHGAQINTTSVENFTITGGAFADDLEAGGGNDRLVGGGGDDVLIAAGGNDDLSGGAGRDNLNGGDGDDILHGGDDGDTLVSGRGADSLYGENGDDLLFSDSGAVIVDGGDGNDTLLFDSTSPGSFSFTFGSDHIGTTQLLNIENYRLEFDGGGDDTVTLTAATLVGASAFFGEGGHDTLIADLSGAASGISMNGFTLTVGSASLDYGTLEEFHITGTAFGDNVLGASGDDVLVGGGGNDIISGDGSPGDFPTGSDTISGGDGDDTLYGGRATFVGDTGNDTIHGDNGNDTIFGGGGSDTLFGDAGNDALIGGDGNDIISGGAGDDTITGDDNFSVGSDAIDGGDGVDTVSYLSAQDGVIVNLATGIGRLGAAEGDTFVAIENVFGSIGDDTLIGQNGVFNTLNGSNGNDIISGGAGADHLDGGADNDTLDYSASSAGVSVHLASNFVLGVASGGDAQGDEIVNFENVTGSAFADVLVGSDVNNLLSGGAGNDILDGGLGADTMSGGIGNDTYIVDNTGDVVIEAGGTDVVQASVSYTIGNGVENLTLTGVGAINGTGNSISNVIAGTSAANTLSGLDGNDLLQGGGGDDTLIGGNGNDILVGGLGADQMSGGIGDDIYVVDNAADVVSEAGGNDLVQASISFTLGNGMESLALTGSAAIDGTGNALSNAITGNAGNNTLSGLDGNDGIIGGDGDDAIFGGNGADRLTGGNGNDYLDGGAGADQLSGGLGNDTYIVDNLGDTVTDNGGGFDTVLSSVSFSMGVGIEVLTLTGLSAINGVGNALSNQMSGNAGANTLTGNDGNDVLQGQDGDDVLIGGNGADVLIGGAGADTFVYQAASDSAAAAHDIIKDFQKGVDLIDLSAVHTDVSDTFFFTQSGSTSILHVDLGGNGADDMIININNASGLTAADIIWGP
ncbi:MAG: calcium-binding protein [Terricaulis sp.]